MEKSTNTAQAVVTPLPAPIAAANGTGSALFVINLCASIAPVRLDGNNIPGLENYRLYQVARNEDGRTRHRLRLGFFTSESHAESVLTVVRQQYPTAFTTCLCEEDRRFTRGFLPDAAAAAAPAPRPVAAVAKPAPAPVAQPKAAAAPAASTAKQATAPVAPAKQSPAAARTLAPVDPEVIELSWEPETPPTEAKAAKPAVKPTDGLDDFSWEPPSLTPAADAAIAKTVATGIVKAKVEPEKNTSDTAKHPALKLAPKVAPPVAKPAKPVAAKPIAKPAAPIVQASKADPASSMRVRALDLTFSDPPPAPVDTQRAAATGAFHVGKGIEIKDAGIRLESEPAKPAAPVTPAAVKPAATKPVVTPAKPAQAPVVAAAKPAAPKPAAAPALPAVRIAAVSNVPPPELDSTQTIRALTSAEMEDAAQEKWFAVQLAVSDQPVNLDAMPRLDIFEAYRLYSVATAGSGKIVHSLRLGFFKEAVSAEAVMGYLNTFFGSPSVMRVSVAEHARFKDAPSTKKPAAPAQEAKVVELNNARSARPVVPTVTMEVEPGVDTAATGSFRPLDTGSFKKSATGKHKALKSAARSAGSTKTARAKTGNTGKHKTLPSIEKKSLAEQLLDEAREVQLSESGIRKLPKNDSLLSRMLGKLTK
ncbi:MAG TPA: hypothetical protein VJS12_17235 [Steroidobacteraceae bacterium]|nr:hypothetical protein [Steroidobacteraceae bacterium]